MSAMYLLKYTNEVPQYCILIQSYSSVIVIAQIIKYPIFPTKNNHWLHICLCLPSVFLRGNTYFGSVFTYNCQT